MAYDGRIMLPGPSSALRRTGRPGRNRLPAGGSRCLPAGPVCARSSRSWADHEPHHLRGAAPGHGPPPGHRDAAGMKTSLSSRKSGRSWKSWACRRTIWRKSPPALCAGTRAIGAGEVCLCLRRYYAREQQKELSRMLDLGSQSFDTFSLEWYSDRAPGPGASLPRRT